jgi:hypothetical protein
MLFENELKTAKVYTTILRLPVTQFLCKQTFQFWDKHLVVDYHILAWYTHGQKYFNLTFNQFFRSCLKDDALFDALKLKEVWPTIPEILAVNEVRWARCIVN